MTPERIEELRDLLANYLTRSSDENKLLAFASEILDIAERFARLRDLLEPLRALEAAAWTNRTIEAAARNALPALLREIQETP